jgi:hypothetical protein
MRPVFDGSLSNLNLLSLRQALFTLSPSDLAHQDGSASYTGQRIASTINTFVANGFDMECRY